MERRYQGEGGEGALQARGAARVLATREAWGHTGPDLRDLAPEPTLRWKLARRASLSPSPAMPDLRSMLRVRVDHLFFLGGGLALLIAVFVTWKLLRPEASGNERPEQARAERDLDARLDDLRRGSGADRHEQGRAQPRFIRGFAPGGQSTELAAGSFEAPSHADPGDLGPDESIDAFKAVMDELEDLAAAGHNLDERGERELYNRATGSFTSMSMWVDQSDPAQRALMEDARQQMMSLMRELGIERPSRVETYVPANMR
ncbi:hypothetical protein G6O69_31150 [Pseudenhygromyxa sp. WMMC2535]|uniref:hypothetical protein n=1 Tax=Pseudenhygromyxa sp. WMMC2535 TaxID=2712867 RepID=UPI0015528A2E|nr:hypothetical protein [Pseudenhygromyxa sp. WMMC2535]NVB42321.1 hypothetical protein [Pseudenhygromyxa sp. WMMC2535]